ncbi:MAG: efflux RND transporter periplasmic adaptor subunit, partial [Candidatus Gastranaerophilaceae bacterium]
MNNSKRIWIILVAIIIVPIIWNKGASFIAGQKTARMMAMPTKVETDTVQEAMINEQNEYVGRIEARKDVKIVSRVSGWLQKKFYNDGDFVKKGQVLFQIEPDEYILAVKNAEAELRRVQANYDNSLIELNRAKELVKGDYVSRSYYDEAFAKYSSDKALVDAAKSSLSKAKLNLGYTKIKAPFDGKIGKLFITEGNYVTAQTGELATLVTVDPIYAKFTVKAEDLLKYRKSSD